MLPEMGLRDELRTNEFRAMAAEDCGRLRLAHTLLTSIIVHLSNNNSRESASAVRAIRAARKRTARAHDEIAARYDWLRLMIEEMIP